MEKQEPEKGENGVNKYSSQEEKKDSLL